MARALRCHVLLAAALVLTIGTVNGDLGPHDAQRLLTRTVGPRDGEPDASVVRARVVDIDIDLLDRYFATPQRPFRVSLELFDDADVIALLDEVETTLSGATVWTGRVDGIDGSSVTIVRKGGAVAAHVVRPCENYLGLRSRRDGRHAAVEVSPQALPQEDEPVPVSFAPRGREAQSIPQAAGLISTIDILVAYTANARAKAGGTDAMIAQIELGGSLANQSYYNSGVNQRIRVVQTAEVSYDDSYSYSSTLDFLQRPTDGTLDTLPLLRDQSGADLVSLIVDNSTLCGKAFLLDRHDPAFEVYGYSVVNSACLANNTLAHELGHNMGCMHDRANSDRTGLYPYSYGYQQPQGKFRTTMAYSSGCLDPCPRILNFSNPAVSHNGDPTGIDSAAADSADSAKTLNASAALVASFRPSKQALTITSVTPPSGSNAGGTSVTIGGTGFVSGSTVKVGGIGASSVAFVNAQTITAVTPANLVGLANVEVTTPAGAHGVLPAGFAYLCATPPAVTITTPSVFCTNQATATASVADAGSGATYQWTITNGSITSGETTRTITWSGYAWKAEHPTLSVTVRLPNGCSNWNTRTIPVVAPPQPVITAPHGTAAGVSGYTASVNDLGSGTGYAWTIANGTITAGGNSRIVTFTPAAAGTTRLDVTATNAGGCSGSEFANVRVVGPQEVVIEGVQPGSGPKSGGTLITITGRNFQPGATVEMTSGSATVTSVTPTAITATTPAYNFLGATYVLVQNPDFGYYSAYSAFRYAISGDVNSDGLVDVADLISLVNHLFAQGVTPSGNADVDGDGTVRITDVFYLVNYFFANGAAPA